MRSRENVDHAWSSLTSSRMFGRAAAAADLGADGPAAGLPADERAIGGATSATAQQISTATRRLTPPPEPVTGSESPNRVCPRVSA